MDLLKQSSATRENLGMLAVMDALENRQQITQRELSQVTGLNLKKVNYCLHKLLERGFVKFQRLRQNPDKRAYLYILTPSGVRAKSQLTYRFLKFTLEFYNKMVVRLKQTLQDMSNAKMNRVVLYGASDVAQILIDMLEVEKFCVVGIIDDSLDVSVFHGLSLIPKDQLGSYQWDCVLITGLENLDEAEQELGAIGVDKSAIWTLA